MYSLLVSSYVADFCARFPIPNMQSAFRATGNHVLILHIERRSNQRLSSPPQDEAIKLFAVNNPRKPLAPVIHEVAADVLFVPTVLGFTHQTADGGQRIPPVDFAETQTCLQVPQTKLPIIRRAYLKENRRQS